MVAVHAAYAPKRAAWEGPWWVGRGGWLLCRQCTSYPELPSHRKPPQPTHAAHRGVVKEKKSSASNALQRADSLAPIVPGVFGLGGCHWLKRRNVCTLRFHSSHVGANTAKQLPPLASCYSPGQELALRIRDYPPASTCGGGTSPIGRCQGLLAEVSASREGSTPGHALPCKHTTSSSKGSS
jgi:hypothetical protein